MKYFLFWIIGFYSLNIAGGFPVYSQDLGLKFEMTQNQKIFDKSTYGEAPQFAIWIKNKMTEKIENVFVTHKTATGNFIGRSGVPVALPYWVGHMEKDHQISGIPSPKNPLPNVDAISGPTPLNAAIVKEFIIPGGSSWDYFIEVNLAGDYTSEFPPYQASGVMDPYENGQPSIVYYGEIDAVAGAKSTPRLIGRTEQMYFDSTLNHDLTGIENAKEVFSDIRVSCTIIQK